MSLVRGVLIVEEVPMACPCPWCGNEIYSYEAARDFKNCYAAKKRQGAGGIWPSGRPEDFVIQNGVLTGYRGRSLKIRVPKEVCALKEGIFSESRLVSVDFSDTMIRELPEAVFRSCSRLEKVVFPQHLQKIGKEAFYNCRLREADLPDTVTEIGEKAFSCSGLHTIRFPASLRILGEEAFYGTDLRYADLSYTDLEEIPEHAFDVCRKLQTVLFPEKLKKIQAGAFGRCSELRYVEFPKSLEYLGADSFLFCRDLRCLFIPDEAADRLAWSLYPFAQCPSLEYVVAPESLLYGKSHIAGNEDSFAAGDILTEQNPWYRKNIAERWSAGARLK